MTRSLRGVLMFSVVMFLVASGTAFGSTIVGAVVDKDGPMPGATVQLSAPGMAQPLMVVTDAEGKYRFEKVPPGTYTIEASLDNATWSKAPPITVVQGKDLEVPPISLITEQVEVKGNAERLIESKTTTQGQTFDTKKLADIPVARASFEDLMKIAPGVSSEGDSTSNGLSVYGATSLESSYIIDGINTTSVESGRAGKQINFDIIERIDIKTAGYEAEFGGAQGAVVDVQTKTGSNEFKGGLSYYTTPSALASEPGQNGYGTAEARPDAWEAQANLGGAILKDKLFFFASVSRKSDIAARDQRGRSILTGIVGNAAGRQVAESTERQDLFFLKTTWQMNAKQRLVASIIADPRQQILRDELAGQGGDHTLVNGGKDYSLLWSWIVNERLYFEAQVGRHSETSDIDLVPGQAQSYVLTGNRRAASPAASIRFRPGADQAGGGEIGTKYGPYAYTGDTEGDRDFAKLALTWNLASHALKFGMGLERGDYRQKLNYGWGTGMALEYSAVQRAFDRTRRTEYVLGVRRCWGDGLGDCLPWEQQVRADGTNDTLVGFAQDRWQPRENITLNAGVRWESQKVAAKSGPTVATLDGNVAPRLGVTWDPLNNGKSKVFGSWGRFYDVVPMQAVSRAYAPRVTSTRLYRVARGGDRDWTAAEFYQSMINPTLGICQTNDPSNEFQTCWDFESGANDPLARSPGAPGGSPVTMVADVVNQSGSIYGSPVVSDLKGAHSDEWTLGAEWQVHPRWTVGFKVIDRQLKKAIEDLSLDNGRNFIIANPGGPYTFVLPDNRDVQSSPLYQGLVAQGLCAWGQSCTISNAQLESFDWTDPATGKSYAGQFHAIPAARRHFRGYEATVNARFSEKLWFTLSYLKSKTDGNYRGRYFTETEERDPNATEAFDTPGLVVNTDGLLPQDRTHQAKVFGNWRVTPALGLGATFRYASGTPYGATTDPSGGSTPLFGPVYMLARGVAGRTPATKNFDLSLSYDVKTDDKLKVTLFLDVFNVLNEQNAVAVDEQLLRTGLYTGASANSAYGYGYTKEGWGEPLAEYVQSFGDAINRNVAPSAEAWNNWATQFQGRFDSLQALYEYLRTATVTLPSGLVAPAYPGFYSATTLDPATGQYVPTRYADGTIVNFCDVALDRALSSGTCRGLNQTYGKAKRLELPRSIRFGIKLSF